MNTLLVTSQILCYGVGIVSASLNIAVFVRRRTRLRRWRAIAAAPHFDPLPTCGERGP